jgi:hypothetical protein
MPHGHMAYSSQSDVPPSSWLVFLCPQTPVQLFSVGVLPHPGPSTSVQVVLSQTSLTWP